MAKPHIFTKVVVWSFAISFDLFISVLLGIFAYFVPIVPQHRLGMAFIIATGFALYESRNLVKHVDESLKDD